MKTKFLGLILLTSLTWIISCGEEKEGEKLTTAEKQRRQDLAFDISGDYFENLKTGTPSKINIDNENSFHDLKLSFFLRKGLNDNEKSQIKMALKNKDPRITVAEQDEIVSHLQDLLDNLVLGEGPTQTGRGGENVVLDAKGEVSEIALTLSDKEFHKISQETTVETYQVDIELYLTAYKTEKSLDFRTTENTDTAGKNSSGKKSLSVEINRTVTSADGYTTSYDYITKLEFSLSTFIKY